MQWTSRQKLEALNQYQQQNMNPAKLNAPLVRKDILNPEQQTDDSVQLPPLLPSPQLPQPPANRLKFRYTVIEKPQQSLLGFVIIAAWMGIIFLLLASSYFNKLNNLQQTSSVQQNQCRADYDKNKCQKGLPATQAYCEQKRKCFESEPALFYKGKISTTFIVGEILKDFVEGAGLYVCLGGLFVVWALVRRNPNRQIKKEYVEYFQ